MEINLNLILVVISVIINIVGAYNYILSTLKGNTKPNRATWLLWGIIPMISVAAVLSEGFSFSVIPVFMAGFIPFLVIGVTFISKNSQWRLNKSDYICVIISVLAIALWILTDNPLLAVIFAVLADGIAAVPTLTKTFKFPETESPGPYFSGVFGGCIGLIVLNDFVALEYLFPLYLIVLNFLILILMNRRKIFKIRFLRK